MVNHSIRRVNQLDSANESKRLETVDIAYHREFAARSDFDRNNDDLIEIMM